MTIRHVRVLPQAYTIEPRPDGLVDVWLCRQVDTYTTIDGVCEHDVDVRVLLGIVKTDHLEETIRYNWEAWWEAATLADP